MTEPEEVGCGVDDVPLRLGSDGSAGVRGVSTAFFPLPERRETATMVIVF
jgi:hypothetical protein